MRIDIIGDNQSAKTLRGYIQNARLGKHFTLSGFMPDYRIYIEESEGDYIYIDSVESELERAVMKYISEITPTGLLVERKKGRITNENEIRICVPSNERDLEAVEKGLLRALLLVSGHGKKKKRFLGLFTFIICLGLISSSHGQSTMGGGTNVPKVQLGGALPAGNNVIGHVIADSGSTTAVTGNVTAVQATGSNLHVQVDTAPSTAVTNAGTFAVQASIAATQTLATVTTVSAVTAITNALPAGTNLLGKTGIDQTTPGSTNGVETLPDTIAGVALTASAKATLTTAVVVKASAGNVYGLSVTNGAASVCWLEFMNASSSPVLGTAAIFSIALPASGTVNIPPGVFALANFSTGISVGIATLVNGSTACGTAGNVTVFYK